MSYKIVRTENAGVFAGEVVEMDDELRVAVLTNARRLWYWSGAASLSQLAMEGTKKPDACKFPCEVARVKLYQVIEVIDCTGVAQDSIKGVPIWKQ